LRTYILCAIFLLLQSIAHGQDYHYVHYDVRDGLPGLTVYDINQDLDGFIWIATANGLCRYDGSHFTNFTVKDGLPDNEVLDIFCDSKNRVWIGTNNNEVSYYYKGKIYNSRNDSVCAHINLKFSGHTNYYEDYYGNIYIYDTKSVYLLDKENQVFPLDMSPFAGGEIRLTPNMYDAKQPCALVVFSGKYYYYMYTGTGWKVLKEFPIEQNSFEFRKNCQDSRLLFSPDPVIRWNAYPSQLSTHYINTINGVYELDTIANKLTHHFLSGKRVSTTFEDKERNIWFATLGDGIYKLASKTIATIETNIGKPKPGKELFCIVPFKNGLLFGQNYNQALLLEKDNKSIHKLQFKQTKATYYSLFNNRVYCGTQMHNKSAVLGLDEYALLLKDNAAPRLLPIEAPVKSISEIDANHIMVASSRGTFRLQMDPYAVVELLWADRSTKTLYQAPYYYIGTTHGLIALDTLKNFTQLGKYSFALSRRINDMLSATDGTIWIATNDEGIVAYKNHHVLRTINDSSGLSSNICKSLFIKNQFLYVGTDKGLNKIDLSDSTKPIVKIGTIDGLLTDNIEAIYVDDSTVYLATPEGLNYFNETRISDNSICNLKVLNIRNDNAILKNAKDYSFSYKNNNFSIEYVGISFKSAGDITYYYKMDGLDRVWNQTKDNKLDYKTLPSGDYVLNLYAINKFGIQSQTLQFHLHISTPYWRAWWFYLLILILSTLLTIFLVNRRNKLEQSRIIEKNKVDKQLSQLEQQALQAQMNPHFIFNCLNSIQQFIVLNNKEKANQYLTGFAYLIRQTLDISNKPNITLEEEILYLTRYLEMEKLRFGDSFQYSIHADPEVPLDQEIPPLLIQPYVENSLRHGLRYVENGSVDIEFSMKEGVLVCCVSDNGIGREKSASYKSSQHIEYQSKGTSLTAKRISLLNHIFEKKINVEIQDLYTPGGLSQGTRVILQFPV